MYFYYFEIYIYTKNLYKYLIHHRDSILIILYTPLDYRDTVVTNCD